MKSWLLGTFVLVGIFLAVPGCGSNQEEIKKLEVKKDRLPPPPKK